MTSSYNPAMPQHRGKTFYNGGTIPSSADWGGVHLEGSVRVFPDLDPSNPLVRRSGASVTCMLVRNNCASLVLLPKQLVIWEAGQLRKRVNGLAVTNGVVIAGVVDEFLPSAGVPVGDLFWLVVDGPTLALLPSVNTHFNGTIVAGDNLQSSTQAATTSATGGRMARMIGTTTFTVTQTTDGGAATIIANSFARAISGSTTSNLNGDLLINVVDR